MVELNVRFYVRRRTKYSYKGVETSPWQMCFKNFEKKPERESSMCFKNFEQKSERESLTCFKNFEEKPETKSLKRESKHDNI